MADLVIFGAGELARLVHLYFEADSPYDVVAFSVDREYVGNGSFCDLPLVPNDELVARYPPGAVDLFIAIGYRRVNRARADAYDRFKALGYRLATYTSSQALVAAGVQVGDNSFFFEGVILQPFVEVGPNTIMWSGATVAHDTTIGSHCFLAPRASISGNVVIGDYCFIGNNATVRDGIKVAPHTVVGAGAIIKRDTAAGEVYAPARTQPRSGMTSQELNDL